MYAILIHVVVLLGPLVIADQYCNTDYDDFQRLCQQVLGGFADGSRCFYIGSRRTDWNDAWGECDSKGGKLAQIHTSAEYRKIVKYLSNSDDDLLWIALKRSDDRHDDGPSLILDKTWWYNSTRGTNKQLVVNNTWVRTRQKDDVDDGSKQRDWNCFALYGRSDQSDNHFGNCDCDQNDYRALCQTINTCQSFSLHEGVCLTETPFLQFKNTDRKECASACTNQISCRSFNFYSNNAQCDLFSWSLSDNPSSKSTDNTCNLYEYVP